MNLPRVSQVSLYKIGLLGGAAALALMALTSPAAQAQEASAATQATDEDILVTAQRRSERAISVPISLTAIDGRKLEELGILQPTQLTNIVPGLEFHNTGPTSVFAIRGITLNDYGDANESPVAFYRDDVYVAALAGSQSQMFDIDRVEVLRGPQGTLFGRNATGGLVSVFSRRPSDVFDARASLQYASFGQVIVEAAVGGPITDSLRIRLSGQFNRDDGWQTNVVTGTTFAKHHSWALRQIVEYDVTENMLATITVHGGKIDNIAPGYGFRGPVDPLTFDRCSDERILALECENFDGFRDPDPDPRHIYSDIARPALKIDTFGASGQLRYFGDGFDLVSITAIERTDKYYEEDGDGSPTPNSFVRYNADRSQFSQELRASGESDRLTWVVGAYYFAEDLNNGLFTLPQYIDLYGGTYGLQNEFEQETRAAAIFAQADYDLSETLKFTGGLRYSNERKSILISDDFSAPAYVDDESVSISRITWKAGLTWTFAPEWLAYASVSTGYKSPAFNTSAALEGGSVGSRPESNTNYEIGIKGQTADRRFQISSAIFHNAYKDIQLVDIPPNSPTPTSQLINAEGADIYGIELELNARPVEGLSINLSATRLWTEIKSPGFSLGGIPLDGHELVASPEWSLKGVVTYEIDAGDAGRFGVRADASYRTRSQHSLTGAVTSQSPAYTLVNAGLSWRPRDSRYVVEVFADNLFDKAYLTYAYDVLSVNALQWGRPRSVGVRISADW